MGDHEKTIKNERWDSKNFTKYFVSRSFANHEYRLLMFTVFFQVPFLFLLGWGQQTNDPPYQCTARWVPYSVCWDMLIVSSGAANFVTPNRTQPSVQIRSGLHCQRPVV